MTTRILTTVTAIAIALSTPACAAPKITFVESPGRVEVKLDGKVFTNYIYAVDRARPLAAEGVLLTKPVLYPLSTPSGTVLTRGWPFEKGEGEKTDHPHHIGLFFTYDEINGSNFWNNSRNKLPAIRHATVATQNDPNGNPQLLTTAIWVGNSDEPLLRESRVTTFIPGDDQHIIDIDIELQAVADKVGFGDTKEGMFAIRLAQWLTESTEAPYTPGTGSYLSSNGDERESGVWGKRAKWVRIEGQRDNKTVGVAILNHPASTNYPTFWHARGYGAFSANPLGQLAFEKSKKVENPTAFGLTLTKGQKAPFKFRVICYDGPRTPEQLEAEFNTYANATE